MWSFLGSIFIVILFVLFFLLMLGVSFIARLISGLRDMWHSMTGSDMSDGYSRGQSSARSYDYSSGQSSAQGYEYSSESSRQDASSYQGDRPHSQGVFADDEGTYVDFEEVKE